MSPRLFAIAGTLLLVLAVACSGDNGDAGPTPGTNGTATPAPGQTPAGTPDGMILYRDFLGDIVARDLESGETYRRATDPAREVLLSAECTRDGSRIALLRQDFQELTRQVIIAGEGATAEPVAVEASVQGIGWAPDGSQLAYNGFSPQTGHTIGVVDPETGDAEEVTTGEGFVGPPRWSPDGSMLAYHAETGTQFGIYVLDLSDGEPRALVTDSIAYDPDWAPDGQTLLFAAMDQNNVFQVFLADIESGEPEQLTASDVYKRQPRYSPDGQAIAFTGSIITPQLSASASGFGLHAFGVFITDPDGGNERPLTADPRDGDGVEGDPTLDAFLMGWCRPGPWLDESWVRE